MSLDARKQKILQAIVRDYILTAEPVGSRTIARRYLMDISAATIRNEMADLEEMGFLHQPHTSAGRIPSESGYRFYVDNLLDEATLSEQEVQAIKQIYHQQAQVLENVIQEAAHLLSSLTDYMALASGPQAGSSRLQKLHMMEVQKGKALVVVVSDNGLVANRMINLPDDIEQSDLDGISDYINRNFYNVTWNQMLKSGILNVRQDIGRRIEQFDQVVELIQELLLGESTADIYLGGTARILVQPEFQDVNRVRSILKLLDHREAMLSLVGEKQFTDNVQVTIGSENQLEEVENCSLVTALYRWNGAPVGWVGVLGPTRMDYARAMTAVREVSKLLTDIFNKG